MRCYSSSRRPPRLLLGERHGASTHCLGGTGLIGSKGVARLAEHGHAAIAASPSSGVNTLTGEGLAEVLAGAQVVVDVSDSPSFEDKAVLDFFTTSTGNLLAAEKTAGVGHHVAPSVVGTEHLSASGYLRAKLAQEKLIKESGIPYSIVHATQFFEFVKRIADSATDGNTVHLSHASLCGRAGPGRDLDWSNPVDAGQRLRLRARPDPSTAGEYRVP
jgi:uncharacterized protein YbjT (DUF2867 family)